MIKTKKRKWPLRVGVFLIVLVLIFLLGPRPGRPDFSTLRMPQCSSDLKFVEDSINAKEAKLMVKPDNNARIVWASPYQKTAYSMVYIHGNGASQEEGDPIHEALAQRYGCNLFLPRLEEHGLAGGDRMLNIDPEQWMQSALDAIAVGKTIGEKVIVISCSTGSTFALFLASRYPDLVEAHIMLSPNIDFYDPRSFMMTWPWGLQASRLIIGSDFYDWEAPKAAQQYWYTHYRIEGLVTLKSIINETMTQENFRKINDPIYLSYYYSDDENQDKVVSVKRMRDMFAQVGTPASLKKEVVIADAGTHIIGSDLFNTHLSSVWTPLVSYCEEVLHLSPAQDVDWNPSLDNRQPN